MKTVIAAGVLLLLSGCASVINDKTHPVRFDARQADGTQVQGAPCTATNDKTSVSFRSGETTLIRRSSKNLEIRCTSPGLADATGSAKSRANAAAWGNILAGGVVGAVIDHGNGKAYTYPNWVQLVFGESRLFDRRDDEEGRPVVGTVTGTTAAPIAAAAPAVASPPPQKVASQDTSYDAPTPVDFQPQQRPAATTTPVETTPAAGVSEPAATAPAPGSNWRNWGAKGR
ncbi:hypothetical protein [uncultured Stenotrophomonas sp.]|uniref:hypothetical protein n=1 Tax=uncultured Stenotrophomonas sp. TaxID=165438 RepID=UPI0025CD34C5|nr:hypothetical protein [uncultured Stenotrophomonas sp.]